MSKLYIFGIGGTGSRVLRAFTMLAATGVRIGQHEIVPIIIDPDSNNSDMSRTVELMDNYIKIRSRLTFNNNNPNQFFRTGINKTVPNFNIPIANTQNMCYKEFIDINSMSRENSAMIKMLFSDDNLNSDMNVGFKGNPNIGSVVLNQIVSSKEFEDFANSFSQGDKIFIVSSIFGGTGASGFPLLVKTLRTGTSFANHAIINQAEIGAITILPYFRVKPSPEGAIDSGTFISKTKSALAYYEKNLAGNNQVNAFYYLGDTITDNYDYSEGGSTQRNNAHLIELLAATAITDFSNNSFDINNSVNKELGIQNIADNDSLTFLSLHDDLRNMLIKPMSQFALKAKLIADQFNDLSSAAVDFNETHNLISQKFYSTPFITNLKSFDKEYIDWLNEMTDNIRQFRPFNLNCGNHPFTIVEGYPEKTGWGGGHKNYQTYIGAINYFKNRLNSTSNEDKFAEVMYLSTEKLLKDRLNIN